MDFIKDLTLDSLRNAAEDAFNQAKPKSEVEARVYEVLSHKNWGSSTTLMNEIARDTYDYDKFPSITKIMWDSMENQRPAAWRVVFKGMMLLEHLIKNGSERCVDDARNHSHLLRQLQQFNYYEGKVDRGLGVREKSKQITEILGDDERIREERQKARKLREKFGGNLGGVGSHDVGGGGGYGGYGNDSESGFRAGGAGYGDSTIGAGGGGFRAGGGGGAGAGGGSGYGGDSGGNFSGRYSDDSATRATTSSASATPTFATIPDDGGKKKLKKKKKKKPIDEVPAPTPAAPEVDLFAFDAPAPAPVAKAAASSVEFDAFGIAPAAPAANSSTEFGDFASFNAVPAPAVQQSTQFDAFQSASTPPMNNSAMGGGTNGVAMAQVSDMFGQMQVGTPSTVMNHNTMNGNGMMGVGMQQQQFQPNGMMSPTPTASNGVDDDFGDFEDAAPKKNVILSSSASSDPMSRLISLDGLTKNTKKQPNKLGGYPGSANAGSNNPSMGFVGIDGMGGQSGNGFAMAMNSSGYQMAGQPMLGTATAGGADVISMMGPPQQMMGQRQNQTMGGVGMQQPGGMNMMNPQMMQQQQGMMQGGMMHNGMQQGGMGMMNPQMMQQGGMGMQQGGMQGGMPGMHGGMPGMQGGMPGMGMGGQPMGGMPGGMGMGGQPMQGWK